MARLGRYFLEGQPLHVDPARQRSRAIFFAPEDYPRYRVWLIAAVDDYGCAFHAYVLMTNHVHLLVTPKTAESLPRAMQSLGRRDVRYINWTYRRTGTLWEGRYRAAPIDSDAYFLSCCRYIGLNPVRARMASHPRDYPWSSYRAHAHGESDTFKRQIAKAVGRRVSPLAKGRPPKSEKDKRQRNLLRPRFFFEGENNVIRHHLIKPAARKASVIVCWTLARPRPHE